MKKIAVMADIHGNITALETALNRIKASAADSIVICGDIVGYGSYPNECCEIIRKLDCPVVAGNHDYAVADLINYKESFSKNAAGGIDYTKQIITSDNLEWLKNLPLQYREDDAVFVHSSLISPEAFYYLVVGSTSGESPYQDVCDNFDVMKEQVCFVGHSHTPAIFLEKSRKNVQVINPSDPFYQLNNEKALIDVGSVGCPRTSSKKASYVLYSPDAKTLTFERFNT